MVPVKRQYFRNLIKTWDLSQLRGLHRVLLDVIESGQPARTNLRAILAAIENQMDAKTEFPTASQSSSDSSSGLPPKSSEPSSNGTSTPDLTSTTPSDSPSTNEEHDEPSETT